jgi:hypothetical protein
MFGLKAAAVNGGSLRKCTLLRAAVWNIDGMLQEEVGIPPFAPHKTKMAGECVP